MNDLRQCRENQIVQTSKEWKENLNPCHVRWVWCFNYQLSVTTSHKNVAIIVMTDKLRPLPLLHISID